MKLEISELINNVGLQSTVDLDFPCPPDAELQCAAPIRGKLTLTNTGHHLLVRGELGTTVQVACSRCLKEIQVPIAAEIVEEFPLPEIDAHGGVHWEIEDEPVSSIFSDYMLDVSELARQHLTLAMPTAPVCDEACKGICPGCGQNLNVAECTCPPPEIDPRFAALRSLLEEKEAEDKNETTEE